MSIRARTFLHPASIFLMMALLITPLPHVLQISGNVFINDYYAKRILAILLLGFGAITLSYYARRNSLPYLISRRAHYLYMFLASVSIVFGASYALGLRAYADIVADLVLLLSPYVYYMGVKRMRTHGLNMNAFVHLAGPILSIITIAGLKHQFSYLALTLSLSALLFLSDFRHIRKEMLLVIALSPAVIYYALVGKSSLVAVAIVVGMFLLTVTKVTTASMLRILKLSLVAALALAILSPIFTSTAAYGKLSAFQFSLDSSESDLSTGHRVFESYQVVNKVVDGSVLNVVFGYGLGASVDLSGTADESVLASNTDPTAVRFVHILPFFFILKFGVLGLVVYVLLMGFTLTIIFREIVALRQARSSRYFYVEFSCLAYVAVIAWDGQVSSGHMLANPVFWMILFNLYLRQRSPRKESDSQSFRRPGPHKPAILAQAYDG